MSKIIEFPKSKSHRIGAGYYGVELPACRCALGVMLINFDKADDGLPLETMESGYRELIGCFLMMAGIGLMKTKHN